MFQAYLPNCAKSFAFRAAGTQPKTELETLLKNGYKHDRADSDFEADWRQDFCLFFLLVLRTCVTTAVTWTKQFQDR